MDIRRIQQVIKFSALHSKQIKITEKKGMLYQIKIIFDMLVCYNKYHMWTNQYLKDSFHKKDKNTRESIGRNYLEKGILRDAWQKDFVENRKFLNKYSQKKYELPGFREKRNSAYTKRYKIGKKFFVEYDVELSRQHYLPGRIKIGQNVTLAKHTFIDYSGNVEIKDNVKIAAGVVIESHHRDLEAFLKGKDVNIGTDLIIEENAYIGLNAIILDSCNYIGKNARIGAGAVVTKDIPDNAVAVGVPAKVVKFIQN